MKKEVKKITLESLLEKKMGADTSKTKEYFSEELGGNLEFVRISPDKVSDLLGQMNRGENSEFSMYQQLAYFSCPLLQDKELIKQYNVSEPFEIIYKVLNNNIAEIYEIGTLLIGWYGFNLSAKK